MHIVFFALIIICFTAALATNGDASNDETETTIPTASPLPTPLPSLQPSVLPTIMPSLYPTHEPSGVPSSGPTALPTPTKLTEGGLSDKYSQYTTTTRDIFICISVFIFAIGGVALVTTFYTVKGRGSVKVRTVGGGLVEPKVLKFQELREVQNSTRFDDADRSELGFFNDAHDSSSTIVFSQLHINAHPINPTEYKPYSSVKLPWDRNDRA